MKVNSDGTVTAVVDGLNLPTSLEFIGNTALVVSLAGEIWKIDASGLRLTENLDERSAAVTTR